MKKKETNQEILLFTATTFAAREWSEKEGAAAQKGSPDELLEAACWNGMLPDMLPGVIGKPALGTRLFLWQIIRCRTFLEIDLCETSVRIDDKFSVNPYYFMPRVVLN